MPAPSTRLSNRKSPCTMHGGPAHASAAGACSCSHVASCSISGRRGLDSGLLDKLEVGVVEATYCCSQRLTWRTQNACDLPNDERFTATGSTEWRRASISADTLMWLPCCLHPGQSPGKRLRNLEEKVSTISSTKVSGCFRIEVLRCLISEESILVSAQLCQSVQVRVCFRVSLEQQYLGTGCFRYMPQQSKLHCTRLNVPIIICSVLVVSRDTALVK